MFGSIKKKRRNNLISSFGYPKGGTFRFDLIEKYFLKKDKSEAFYIISEKTCNDLDLHEMFQYLDRTHSKIGQQYLYYKIRRIQKDSDDAKINEAILSKIANDSDFRIEMQEQLSKLNKASNYYLSSLFQEKHIEKPKWFFVVPLLGLTSLLSLISIFINPEIFILFIGVFICNLIIHYWNKRNVNQYLESFPQLFTLNKVAKRLFEDPLLQELDKDLLNSAKSIDQVKNRLLFFRIDVGMENDITAAAGALFELLNVMFLLEPMLLFSALKKIDTRKREIDRVFEFVGRSDYLLSIASLRKGLPHYSVPSINSDSNRISFRGLFHPIIEDCIINDIDINKKSILITGSNMSGKTTFIRTLGINLISGLTLNTCFSETATISRVRLQTYIRISDDLLNNKSYYFEEVLTIKQMLDLSTREGFNLFLLDEIFKGTNTIERISAGKAVLSYLAKNQNKVIISTHDLELAEMLKQEYELYHFSEKVESSSVGFDYKIKRGMLTERNAIKILKLNGYPDSIIEEAFRIADEESQID